MFSRKKQIKFGEVQTDKYSATQQKKEIQNRSQLRKKKSLIKNFSETLSGGITNFTFASKGLFSGGYFEDDKMLRIVLGKKFYSKKEVEEQIKKIIWFTYREINNIPNVDSDLNWGCMIRVGQMAFSAALKKELIERFPQKNEFQINHMVISSFLDQKQCPQFEKYSLRKIVDYSRKVFHNIDYGKWFSTSQICSALIYLHSNSRLKGTQKLQAAHFPSGIITFSKIYELLGYKTCDCMIKKIACRKCHGEISLHQQFNKGIQTYNSKNQVRRLGPKEADRNRSLKSNEMATSAQEKHIVIFISQMIGQNKIKKEAYDQLLYLMNLPQSLGVLGGTPNRGLYLVGVCQKQLYYLDPHFMHDEILFADVQKRKKQFCFPNLRKLCKDDLDPSMAFAFFIRNLAELEILDHQIQKLNQKYGDAAILSIQWKESFAEISGGDFFQNEEEQSVYNDLTE